MFATDTDMLLMDTDGMHIYVRQVFFPRRVCQEMLDAQRKNGWCFFLDQHAWICLTLPK